MSSDPVESNPDHYRVVFENERVRVLEYRDDPGARTSDHRHPDSVMISLSDIRRRLYSGGLELDVEIPAGVARWLPAQEHGGENIGDIPSHAFFVELKEAAAHTTDGGSPALGPSGS